MRRPAQPGPLILFGSGETASVGASAAGWLLERVPAPPRGAILETPAGFEPNSAQVAGRWAAFLGARLPGGDGSVLVVPARSRETAFSPDAPEVVAPLLEASFIGLGAGSPTYAIRQLAGSLAWAYTLAAHALGAGLVLASASTVAVGTHALPVYEIYKVGEPLHWKPGLDLLGAFGLRLAIVPHWNNTEGGAALDTGRCYMGAERFQRLAALLPSDVGVLGIDEHTALAIEPCAPGAPCRVVGRGAVTVQRAGAERRFTAGSSFAAAELGPFRVPDLEALASRDHAERVLRARAEVTERNQAPAPDRVQELVDRREAARRERDWPLADQLRGQIAALGWQVDDTPEGPRLSPAAPAARPSRG